jgi:hypothetical protein
MGRRPEPRGGGGGGPAARSGGTIEAVFKPYDPSERVKALTADMVADIRQRLNVTVEVPEGEPPAAAPVESFKDMVGLMLGALIGVDDKPGQGWVRSGHTKQSYWQNG